MQQREHASSLKDQGDYVILERGLTEKQIKGRFNYARYKLRKDVALKRTTSANILVLLSTNEVPRYPQNDTVKPFKLKIGSKKYQPGSRIGKYDYIENSSMVPLEEIMVDLTAKYGYRFTSGIGADGRARAVRIA